MDRSDYQVISQCNTLKRSILNVFMMKCAPWERSSLASLFCWDSTFFLRNMARK